MTVTGEIYRSFIGVKFLWTLKGINLCDLLHPRQSFVVMNYRRTKNTVLSSFLGLMPKIDVTRLNCTTDNIVLHNNQNK